MSGSGRWDDLAPRLISAVVLAVVGLGLLWLGGWAFLAGLVVLAALGIWELHRLLDGPKPKTAGAIAGVAIAACGALVLIGPRAGEHDLFDTAVLLWMVPLLGAALFTGSESIENKLKLIFVGYGALFLLSIIAFFLLREEVGGIFALFLVLIVVATDVAGYFAGRILGGPKFWPRLSPKKTWSGTIAGWLAAMIVAWAILPGTALTGFLVFVVAPLLSFASQMGDIAASAIKRKMGVKDASNLIPGHGGILDRFDGMAGAGALTMIVLLLGGFGV